MQKKIIVALIAAAAAFPAFAQKVSPFYLGASVNYMEQKIGQDDGSIKKSKAGGEFNGGVDFNKNFGLQSGLLIAGESKFGLVGGGTVKFQPRTVYLVGTATGAVDEKFSVFAKAGVAYTSTKVSVDSTTAYGSDDENKTTGVIGVGGKFMITNNMSAILEYTHFGKVLDEDGGNLKLTGYSFGLRYNF